MFRKIIATSAVIMVSLGFSQVSMAAQESAETATIVVYRADESFKTEKLGLDVHIGEASMGRLKSEQAVVITRPAGEYALGNHLQPGAIAAFALASHPITYSVSSLFVELI